MPPSPPVYPQVLREAHRRLQRWPEPDDFDPEDWQPILNAITVSLRYTSRRVCLMGHLHGPGAVLHAFADVYERLQDHYVDFSLALGAPETADIYELLDAQSTS